MSFVDNSNNLYADPNAYILGCKSCKPQKVVFSEPYETLPNFYIDNNFTRKNCSCVPNPNKPCACPPYKGSCNIPSCKPSKKPFCYPKDTNCFPPDEERPCYEPENNNKPREHNTENNSKSQPYQGGGLPFNLNGIMNMLGGLGGSGGLGNLISMLGANKNSSTSGGMADLLKGFTSGGGLSSLLGANNSSSGGLANLVSAFTNSGGLSLLGNLFKKKQQTASSLSTPKNSDICIKDYKRVE